MDKAGKGEADFAFLGPSLYIQAHDKYRAVPLAQVVNSGKPSFYGVIAVKKGKGITSLRSRLPRTGRAMISASQEAGAAGRMRPVNAVYGYNKKAEGGKCPPLFYVA